MSTITCFYAYSTHNVASEFLVRAAIGLINDEDKQVRIIDWKEASIGGTKIIEEVCKDIDDCELFICDLTDLNPNVLFELGYSITTDKRVWITKLNNDSVPRGFPDELGMLESIGYVSYTSAFDIQEKFWKQAPHEDLLNTLFQHKIRPLKQREHEPKLLYLKSPVATTDSDSLTRHLLKIENPPQIDNPTETKNRSLEWYIDTLLGAYGVLVHFAPQESDEKNAKLALISGMVFGLGKNLLMLARDPYTPAFDYRDLIYTYSSTSQRNDRINSWLNGIQPSYQKMLSKYSRFTTQQEKLQALLEFKNIDLGEYEAENEREKLVNYFVESNSYVLALRTSTYMIFSGRKGSGKTANFYRMGETLRLNPLIRVCYIKPVAYDLQGVYELYQEKLTQSTKTHIIETLWKFLIYTELAFDLYKSLQSKSAQEYSQAEKDIYNFVDKTEYMKQDFTIRLDTVIHQLYQAEVDSEETIAKQRDQFSNILHQEMIAHLRILLGKFFSESTEKVYVLIDNLDQAWVKGADLHAPAQFLFGLLNVIERIHSDFQLSDSRRHPIPFILVVFIRSDILEVIRNYHPERDKLRITAIDWNNEVLRLRIIENRFMNSLGEGISENDVWVNYFARNIDGLPVKTYLLEYTLPRPRDIIYFVKQCWFHAVINQHTRIDEEDVAKAQIDYSDYIYDRLLEETDSQLHEIKSVLRKFLNSEEIVTRTQIEAFVRAVESPDLDVNKVIDVLCDANFLGYEVSTDRFVFVYDDRKEDRKEQAKRLVEETGMERYLINKPFHSHFEIGQ